MICSEMQTIFCEDSYRKAVTFEEQIMSEGKHSSIFSHKMEAIVFIVFEIFFATHAVFKIWGISPGYSPVLAGE